ncbi:hypothetical protein DFA_09431 [Cavenderia fasciculata]|uniref:Uncharacterized protein n=1 Tax=Cavenderia fasciculata TaxID=261658 RepID=F4Q7L5_CACFS|nr:uncharacterized protein DFA_09431 [Cavenderia fasciculata]EGG16397.1 hypothetical protein DFA_09431 [Cavenderia fasciculata]|eukprot:XP_004354781.1 hypothetical protein DFA_09431 [Cavenderia fasciculata]
MKFHLSILILILSIVSFCFGQKIIQFDTSSDCYQGCDFNDPSVWIGGVAPNQNFKYIASINYTSTNNNLPQNIDSFKSIELAGLIVVGSPSGSPVTVTSYTTTQIKGSVLIGNNAKYESVEDLSATKGVTLANEGAMVLEMGSGITANLNSLAGNLTLSNASIEGSVTLTGGQVYLEGAYITQDLTISSSVSTHLTAPLMVGGNFNLGPSSVNLVIWEPTTILKHVAILVEGQFTFNGKLMVTIQDDSYLVTGPTYYILMTAEASFNPNQVALANNLPANLRPLFRSVKIQSVNYITLQFKNSN